MIVFIGKTGSGKTTTALMLEREGFIRAVTDSTRHEKKNEVDGKDYNFISEEKFQQNIRENKYTEYTHYHTEKGDIYFGSRNEIYEELGNRVIVLNPEGLMTLREKNIPCIAIYLNVSEKEIRKRLKKRGDSEEEIERRIIEDNEDYKDVSGIRDIEIFVDGKTKEAILLEVLEKIVYYDDEKYTKKLREKREAARKKLELKEQAKKKPVKEETATEVPNRRKRFERIKTNKRYVIDEDKEYHFMDYEEEETDNYVFNDIGL